MSSKNDSAPYLVRSLVTDDESLLRRFSCAKSAESWQLEVQEHIRQDLAYWVHAPGAQAEDPRGLVVLERATGSLVGVVAHERESLISASGELLPSTRLHVAALAVGWQGIIFPDGRRASDVVMSAAVHDIATRVPPRGRRVHAFVHEDNVRSRALCRRYGLTLDHAVDSTAYRRLSTPGPP